MTQDILSYFNSWESPTQVEFLKHPELRKLLLTEPSPHSSILNLPEMVRVPGGSFVMGSPERMRRGIGSLRAPYIR